MRFNILCQKGVEHLNSRHVNQIYPLRSMHCSGLALPVPLRRTCRLIYTQPSFCDILGQCKLKSTDYTPAYAGKGLSGAAALTTQHN